MSLLSIIVPAYNEERTIAQLIQKVQAVDFAPHTAEIIVVDDGSRDRTPSILQSIRDIQVVSLSKNSGKGSAIRAGLSYASGEYVVIQDADLEYEPQDIKRLFLYALEHGKLPVVYGSRNLRQENPRASFMFYAGGVFLSFLANLLYGLSITDEPTCYKLFRRDVLEKMHVRARSFEFCPEVTAKAARLGYQIPELPIAYSPRGVKDGKKIGWRDGLLAIWTLIKYRVIPVSWF